MTHPATLEIARDELLEELWTARESGHRVDLEQLATGAHAALDLDWVLAMESAVDAGLARRDGEALELTAAGERAARPLIRRHRLAELLLNQVLELAMNETELNACRMEHILSPEATDAVCSFLGHPPVCPHGRAIPPGDCCRRQRSGPAPLLRRLAELDAGAPARVVLVAPTDGDHLDQLADLGLVPGAVVTVRQHRPSLVVEVGHTQLALDHSLARGLLVRPVSP